MIQKPLETCSNCGRSLPRATQAYVLEGRILCEECDRELRKRTDGSTTCEDTVAIQRNNVQSTKRSNYPIGGPIGKIIFALMIVIGIPIGRWYWSRLVEDRGPSEKQVNSVVENLPTNGVYSDPEGSGGSYRETEDNSFEAEIPQGYEFVSNDLRKPGIRLVEFKCGRREIRCIISAPPHEQIKKMGSNNLRYRVRMVTIDGVEGVEEVLTLRKEQLVRLEYEKYGYLHSVNVSFPLGKFPKYANELLTFLRSYRALKSGDAIRISNW